MHRRGRAAAPLCTQVAEPLVHVLLDLGRLEGALRRLPTLQAKVPRASEVPRAPGWVLEAAVVSGVFPLSDQLLSEGLHLLFKL